MPFITRLLGFSGPKRAEWVVAMPMLYRDLLDGTVYIVPPSAHSDLASIPRIARPMIPGNGHERQPAVIHDRAYEALGRIEVVRNVGMLPPVPDDHNPWKDAAPSPFEHHYTPIEARVVELFEAGALDIGFADLTRAECDALFDRANRCARVHTIGRPLMYAAVRAGGWVPWGRSERAWECDPEAFEAALDLTSHLRRAAPPAMIDAYDV